jgi:hypothetical protein
MKTNRFYKINDNTFIKVLKINHKVDKSVSVNLFWYGAKGKVYVEDFAVELITKFTEVENFNLVEVLYD